MKQLKLPFKDVFKIGDRVKFKLESVKNFRQWFQWNENYCDEFTVWIIAEEADIFNTIYNSEDHSSFKVHYNWYIKTKMHNKAAFVRSEDIRHA